MGLRFTWSIPLLLVRKQEAVEVLKRFRQEHEQNSASHQTELPDPIWTHAGYTVSQKRRDRERRAKNYARETDAMARGIKAREFASCNGTLKRPRLTHSCDPSEEPPLFEKTDEDQSNSVSNVSRSILHVDTLFALDYFPEHRIFAKFDGLRGSWGHFPFSL